MLNFKTYGEEREGVPLIIAHGLFGSARNWGVIAKRLSDARKVVAVDMRNHGESPHFDHHDYASLAEDLAEVITHQGGCADVLGHSMGGKAAMVLALARPECLRHLIVADIAPVAYAHTQLPVVEAMKAVDLIGVKRRGEVEAQLRDTIPEPSLRAFLVQSLDITAAGAGWKLNLNVLADEMSLIMGFPRLDTRFDGRVDFLLGSKSDYVSDNGWDIASGFFPNARKHVIEGAGHWLHAEAPRLFEEKLRDLLSN